MTAVPNSPDPYLPAYTIATGVKLDSSRNGWALSNTTYYVPFGAADALIESVHVTWDAVAVGTITVEDSNFPEEDVTSYHSTADGKWLQENPSTAYVPILGGSPVAMTVTIPGGTAGGAMFNLGNLGTRRVRLVIVLSTGGRMNALAAGKK